MTNNLTCLALTLTGIGADASFIRTVTATENNGVAQKVLCGLHSAYRPEHILKDLDFHITQDSRDALTRAHQSIMTELEWELSICGCTSHVLT